jgi:cytochrome c oxidase cbb3-type subunit 3
MTLDAVSQCVFPAVPKWCYNHWASKMHHRKVAIMKRTSLNHRRGVVPCTAAVFAVVLAGYAISGVRHISAQQEGRRQRPPVDATGGVAAGPGEGAQAAAAGAARGGLVAYPDRPKAPQEVLDRGRAAFGVNCAFCHGSDAGGGSVGPNLLRSEVVLQDKRGELIAPIVHGARADRGMPAINITDAQVGDIADWLHSLKVSSRAVMTEKINIVVGNAQAGKGAFDHTCGSCHSVDGDLKGFAAKYTDPRAMQQAWLLPSGAGRGFGPAAAGPAVTLKVPPVTATVNLAGGKKITGKLDTIDDFYVAITTEDGVVHRYSRMNDVPKVDLHDPMEAHRALFRKYDDKDIHDITAYLESLK